MDGVVGQADVSTGKTGASVVVVSRDTLRLVGISLTWSWAGSCLPVEAIFYWWALTPSTSGLNLSSFWGFWVWFAAAFDFGICLVFFSLFPQIFPTKVLVGNLGVVMQVGSKKKPRRLEVEWAQIEPWSFGGPVLLHMVMFLVKPTSESRGFKIALTRDQAKAVFLSPKCPHWAIPAKYRKTFGLTD